MIIAARRLGSPTSGRRTLALLWGFSAAVLLAAPSAAQRQAARPGATYATIEDLPDWSGWWGHGTPVAEEWLVEPPPFKPAILAASRAARSADTDLDPLRYCRPPQFTGSSGGFVEAVEFLFTPGRVTLTNEGGLIRRIYTDGRPMPAEVDATNAGTSIGRWEGQTLVVETIGINPQASYPGVAQGSVPVGENVRITERIFLKDPDTLQFDIVTVAPDILTEPDRRTRLYSRLPKTMASEVTFCTEYDRSIEPGTGAQRFDLTPPADLPPPPR